MENGKECIPEKVVNYHQKKIPIEIMKILFDYTEKKICKIYCNDGGRGTGFFCTIPLDDLNNNLKVLMTNNYIIGENDLKPDKIIKFILNNEKEEKEIILDEERIKYTSEKYDITIIEIKDNDGIKNESFLEIDNKIFDDYKIYLKQKIYLLQYPKGKEMNISIGLINYINEDKNSIEYICDSNVGSSGGPLINAINYKVIGIHKGGKKGEKNDNLGTLIVEPIKEFINIIKNKKKKKKKK
jgi:V8-like Glu-specific endopeptidase